MQRSPLVLLLLAAVPFLFNTGLQVSGFNNAIVAGICWSLAGAIVVWAAIEYVHKWHRYRINEGLRGVQASHLVLIGIAGTWLFATLGFGAAAWMIWKGEALSATSTTADKADDKGPLQFVNNLWVTNVQRVFYITFRGANISKDRAVRIREAKIISMIDGSEITLEIVGVDAKGEIQTVPLGDVQLIPPGASIQLVAKFGDLDNEKRLLGIEPKAFLDKWRKFALTVGDDDRSYRIEFNENIMAVLFEGKVGPRVTVKEKVPAK